MSSSVRLGPAGDLPLCGAALCSVRARASRSRVQFILNNTNSCHLTSPLSPPPLRRLQFAVHHRCATNWRCAVRSFGSRSSTHHNQHVDQQRGSDNRRNALGRTYLQLHATRGMTMHRRSRPRCQRGTGACAWNWNHAAPPPPLQQPPSPPVALSKLNAARAYNTLNSPTDTWRPRASARTGGSTLGRAPAGAVPKSSTRPGNDPSAQGPGFNRTLAGVSYHCLQALTPPCQTSQQATEHASKPAAAPRPVRWNTAAVTGARASRSVSVSGG